ncbi:unnamed protein product [Amaranthus hypochondriacus]
MDTEPIQFQESQLASLLGPESAPFEILISHLMSSLNEQRSQAEIAFNLCKETNPDSLTFRLVSTLQFSSNNEIRAMSTILLRNLFTRSKIWTQLSPVSQSSLKIVLLECLQRADCKTITNKLCDVISAVASAIIPHNGWPEIFPFLFNCVSSDDVNLQESSFLIIAQLSESIGYTLIPYIKDIHSVFLNCLTNSQSFEVKIAVMYGANNFIQCIVNSGDKDSFRDLLPAMMNILPDALNASQESTAREAIIVLMELAKSNPRLLIRIQIGKLVDFMLQMARAEQLDEGTRHLAIEFVITIAEASDQAPGMMKKLLEYVSVLFEILMKMLLDIEDDPAWYSAEVENEDAGETSNYVAGLEYLNRLSIAFGGDSIIPVASKFFHVYLTAPEWQKHHAALLAVAQIAYGCSKEMIKCLAQVVNIVLKSFQDPHPRVRWAAITAIGALCTDFGPGFQMQYHQHILPALADVMDDFQHPRLQERAVSAVISFTKDLTPDILTPYMDGIVTKLLALLQNGKQLVQEEALTVLSMILYPPKEDFQKYYDAVIPYLEAILINATEESNRMLRAEAIECITVIGMAVGKDKFQDDAKLVIEVLISLQGSLMESDDLTSYILQAWARLCSCLGAQDFLPYMSVVMPPLLRSAQLKPDMNLTSAESYNSIEQSENDIDDSDDERIEIKNLLLEEKKSACNLLYFYACKLKEGFYPWINQVAPTLVPLLEFHTNEDIRRDAVLAMPVLLLSAKLAMKKGLAQGNYVKQLSDYIVPALVNALHKENYMEILDCMLVALNKCIQISETLLEEDQVRAIADAIKKVLSASSLRKEFRASRTSAENFDAEKGDLLKEESKQEVKLFYHVGKILETLIKTFKVSLLPFFEELSSYLLPMWGKDKTAGERRVAIFIYINVVTQCREAALKYYDTYLTSLFEACIDEDAGVRKAALYALGVCAQYGGLVFKSVVGEALSILNVVIHHPQARNSNNVMAYDTAVSALGKICHFHRDKIDSSQVIPAWLNCLPIIGDLNQAKVVHERLCWMVERADVDLLGPNNENIPKIITVFAKVLCDSKNLAMKQTAWRMLKVLMHLHKTLPPGEFASSVSSLNPQQQETLQSILLRTQFYKVPNFGRILFKANKNNGEHAIISNKAYNSLATGSDKIYQCEETAIELHREGISVKLYWNNSFKASAHKAAYKECPKHGLNCKFTAEKCAKGSQ